MLGSILTSFPFSLYQYPSHYPSQCLLPIYIPASVEERSLFFTPVENGSTVWSVWEMRFLGKWYFKCSNLRFSGKDAIGRFIFWICILGSTHAFLFWNFSRYSRGSLTRLWYLNIVKWWRQFLECRILLLPTASLLFIQGIWYCSQSLYEITFF